METSRKKELEEIINFSEDVDKRINEMLGNVGWKEESLEKVEESIVCPFDHGHHLLNNQNLEEHLEKCMWKAEGYSENDIPLSELFVPPNSPSCIQFDEKLMEEVLSKSISSQSINTRNRLIPRTSDRLTADFSAEEKRIIYDYVIANTVSPEIGHDIDDLSKTKKEEKEKTSSYLELLAQERNLKRRKTKYRGVHTNKKSQVEIIREVISQQMEMLVEHIQQNDPKPEIKKEDSVREDRKRRYSGDFDNHKSKMSRSREENIDKKNGYTSYWSNDYNREYESRSRKYDEKYPDYSRKLSRDSDRRDHDSQERNRKSEHKKHKRHKSKERESSKHKKSKHHYRDYDYNSRDKKRR